MSVITKVKIQRLVDSFGWLYSDELGINLRKKKLSSQELFDWFLASYFVGVSLDDEYGLSVFKAFKEKGLDSPDAIVKSNWQRLMFILKESGAFTADDFKSVADLMVCCDNLNDLHGGDLVAMHSSSKDARGFERNLRGLKALPVNAERLFLRELRGCLKFADPIPEVEVVRAAKDFKLTLRKSGRPVLKDLRDFWKKKNFAKTKFRNFETALYWHGKHLDA